MSDEIDLHKTPSRRALEAAIKFAGSQKRLGVMCGIHQQNISRWLQDNRVPAEGAVAIEAGTGGKFSRGDFRPDLWPAAATA